MWKEKSDLTTGFHMTSSELKLKFTVSILLGPVPRKMVTFNPGLSLVLRKVFFSKDMQLKLKKYC